MSLRRLLERLSGCAHDGRMTHVRSVGRGAESWRCERCGHEVICLDIDVFPVEAEATSRVAA